MRNNNDDDFEPFANENDPEHYQLLQSGYIWVGNSSNDPASIIREKQCINEDHIRGPFPEILVCQNAYDIFGRRITDYVSLWGRTLNS